MTDLFRVPSLWLAGELAVFQIDHLSCRVYPLTRADLAGSIPDRFNEIAAHDPQKMAVCDHVKSLTYLEPASPDKQGGGDHPADRGSLRYADGVGPIIYTCGKA